MIIAHMVVGPGEANRYLDVVLNRARTWADYIHLSLDARATEQEEWVADQHADSYGKLNVAWEDHEGKCRQAAWEQMEKTVGPTTDDYVFLLDADEIVYDYDMVKKAAREYPDKKIGFVFYEMWSKDHYRIDGHWKPYTAWVLIPYRPGGHFKDRALACGREPTYASMVPMSGKPVGRILHYGYARAEDRLTKIERYQRLDGGKYHSPEHLKSIGLTPSLKKWEYGGLIDV